VAVGFEDIRDAFDEAMKGAEAVRAAAEEEAARIVEEARAEADRIRRTAQLEDNAVRVWAMEAVKDIRSRLDELEALLSPGGSGRDGSSPRAGHAHEGAVAHQGASGAVVDDAPPSRGVDEGSPMVVGDGVAAGDGAALVNGGSGSRTPSTAAASAGGAEAAPSAVGEWDEPITAVELLGGDAPIAPGEY
jgi:hypothetical protein